MFKVSENKRKVINCRSTNTVIRGASLSIVRKISDAYARTRIRRAYNNGDYNKALSLSNSKLHNERDKKFLQDIICRSLYNLGKYADVISFVDKHNLDTHRLYEQKSNQKVRILGYECPTPDLYSEKKWDSVELISNWHQEENRVWLRHPWGWTYWEMPETYQLENTCESLLYLALEVLLSPFLDEVSNYQTKTRPFGSNLALSYSGGIDSTAAAILLPEKTILAYHKRTFESMLSHELAESLFDKMKTLSGHDVMIIPSNHEKIRTYHDLPNGFSTEFASASHLILLADHLDLNGIAFGTPIDNTWLKKGKQFRNFSEAPYFVKWRQKFASAGLHYVLPINHISEAGALEICRKSEFVDYVNSCLRGKNQLGCGKCWKCFHKNGPLGRPFDIESKEINKFLHQKPLRTAQHALWAVQKMNLNDRFPHLSRYLEGDFSWWEKAYPPGIEIIPDEWRSGIKENSERYLEWMEEPFDLEKVNLDI